MAYPEWIYYPTRSRPPEWVQPFVNAIAETRATIDSTTVEGLRSDMVLLQLRPRLLEIGFTVEASKLRVDRIRRPVLFGENGRERVAYEVDAIHDTLGVVVEIEAGRGARGNAVYRDLVRASLIVDARYLALGVMRQYRHQSSKKTVTVQSYTDARALLDAVYASGRLRLPFEGVLLFGY